MTAWRDGYLRLETILSYCELYDIDVEDREDFVHLMREMDIEHRAFDKEKQDATDTQSGSHDGQP